MPPEPNKGKASGSKKSSAPTKETAAHKAPVKKKNHQKWDASHESSDDSNNLSEALTGPKWKPHKRKKIELHEDDQSNPEPEVIEVESNGVDGGHGDAGK